MVVMILFGYPSGSTLKLAVGGSELLAGRKGKFEKVLL